MKRRALVLLQLMLGCLRAQSSRDPMEGGIEFVGSSIFRLWPHLDQQMAPLPVFNRAFLGATTNDWLARAERTVIPYHPKIVVYYCGSNDIDGGASAEEIVGRTKQFIRLVQEKVPGVMVFYTAIQKAPEKEEYWDVVEKVNQEMEQYAKETPRVGFIDLNPVLFDAGGRLRRELFLSDGLHFRPDSTAYTEFAAIVKPVLLKAWEAVK